MQFSELRKWRFFIPPSITFLNPKTLGFLFRTKNSLTWSVECEKYASDNRRDEFIRKLYVNGTVYYGLYAIFASPNRYFTAVVWWPWLLPRNPHPPTPPKPPKVLMHILPLFSFPKAAVIYHVIHRMGCTRYDRCHTLSLLKCTARCPSMAVDSPFFLEA